jgi:hypothetical protein
MAAVQRSAQHSQYPHTHATQEHARTGRVSQLLLEQSLRNTPSSAGAGAGLEELSPGLMAIARPMAMKNTDRVMTKKNIAFFPALRVIVSVLPFCLTLYLPPIVVARHY